jgi:IS1 family transposase
MIPHHVYYQLAIVGLLWLCIMLHYIWPSRDTVLPQLRTELVPLRFKRNRANEPKPFAGLTQRPHCAACAHDANHPQVPPPQRPEPMPPTHRRPCAIDTSRQFCPHTGCDYRGWLGLGNLRANGHPSGGLWRQLYGRSCKGYFLETHGTIFHGKRLSVELIVRVLACWAEGLGIRATARVFEVDPDTGLQWLVAAAAQLQTFTSSFLCDMHVTQRPLDELYAVIRALKTGESSEDDALKRLEGARPWVWTAIDPVSKVLLAIEVGPRTVEMAQRVVHQVAQRFASTCMPLGLSDGFTGYLPAILGHFGAWHQPERTRAQGPAPKPRWMPLPGLLYAQVVKQYRRQRVVGVQHRVVFGTLERVQHVLAACGWKINTSFIERLNLDRRQRVAAIGRRVNTLCQGEDAVQHQLALFHVYHNFVLPHTSLRQPLQVPEPTHGRGSAKVWQPCTPAMAAGLTAHVWTLQEGLLFRVPPWPQPHAV